MPLKDRLLALLLVTIWGVNFVAIKIGVSEVPPLFLGALRFIFVAFPAILIVPRPRVPFSLVLGYALTISFGQFAFLFSAIYVGMPAGLSSLVLQAQVFITLVLAAIIFGDRMRAHNFVGLTLAAGGVVALASASAGAASAPLMGFALTLCAAACWATGNMFAKKIGATDLLGLIAWSGLVPIVPFLAASFVVEGWPRISAGLAKAPLNLVGVVAFLSFGASLIGYSLWSWLIAHHPVYKVAPLALMVPIVGMASSWLLLGETLTLWQAGASLLVMVGLIVNVFGGELMLRARSMR